MERRTLTKKQKFELEMIYKPMILEGAKPLIPKQNLIKLQEFKGIKLVDEIVKGYLGCFTKDDLFLFLSEFDDIVNWRDVVLNAGYTDAVGSSRDNFIEFLDCFKEQLSLDEKCWHIISMKYDVNSNEDIIRRFKDYLDWEVISKRHKFSLDFLVEMKDYVDKKVFFNSLLYDKEMKQILLENYFIDNFDHILEYGLNQKKETE